MKLVANNSQTVWHIQSKSQEPITISLQDEARVFLLECGDVRVNVPKQWAVIYGSYDEIRHNTRNIWC